jgi:hypothetical protein
MNEEVLGPEVAAKPRTRRRGEPASREVAEAEQIASSQAIRLVSEQIRSRAQGLRRLSYLLLAAIVILLVGGLSVLFWSQILLISNSTEQSNAIRKAQDQISQEKQNLDQMASEFIRLRQDIAAAASVAAPPNSSRLQ